MKTYDEHLLADADLVTQFGNQIQRIEQQQKEMLERIAKLDNAKEKLRAAEKALDLPATYRYRRTSQSFKALVAEDAASDKPKKPRRRRAKKKTGRPKTARSRTQSARSQTRAS